MNKQTECNAKAMFWDVYLSVNFVVLLLTGFIHLIELEKRVLLRQTSVVWKQFAAS